MAQDRLETYQPAVGEEIRPAIGKLLGMLLFCLLLIVIGAAVAYSWWFQVELFAGKVFTTKAGIFGLVAIPLGIVFGLLVLFLLISAKRLVIGADCVQMQSRGNVVVHIPYANIVETYAKGSDGAGVVGLRLRDRLDSATLVPSWTQDRYEIQVMIYRKPLKEIHELISQRLKENQVRSKA